LNNEYHRVDGPAIEYRNGEKHWVLNGIRHRSDGPAIEYAHGAKAWWLNGKEAIQIENQDIIIGKSIEINDDIGIVLKHIEGVFYEVLFGNKKELVVKC